MVRLAFAIASLAVASHAQERCDGANTDKLRCADVPEIMALQSTDCHAYHILISRGTDERPPGRAGNVTRLICDRLGGAEYCSWENVDYPAKNRFISDHTWCDSADVGARNGQKQMKEYVKKCPKTKLILLGLSQGASITQDFLGGGGGHIFKCDQVDNPPFDRAAAPGANVAAAVTFGTVSRVSGASYAVKEGRDFHAAANRSDEQRIALEPYASVLRDYCNTGDPICAADSEGRDLQIHLTYFLQYQEEIVDWVVQKVTGKPRTFLVTPLLHQVQDHYWLTGALLLSLVLSWGALFFYTSVRKRLSRAQ